MTPYYQHAGITIYHGDCRELLPALKADLLCTDPPYGINVARRGTVGSGGKTGFGGQRRQSVVPVKNYGVSDWDSAPPADWLFGLMRERTEWQIIFGGNYFPLPPSRCWLVWDKDNTGNFADCELAWTNLSKAVRKFTWRWNGMLQEDTTHKEFRVHPTQKPLAVMQWAISQAPDTCNRILDPYVGSGTTLVAAKALGREAIGIEREEKYCEAAANRLRQVLGIASE